MYEWTKTYVRFFIAQNLLWYIFNQDTIHCDIISYQYNSNLSWTINWKDNWSLEDKVARSGKYCQQINWPIYAWYGWSNICLTNKVYLENISTITYHKYIHCMKGQMISGWQISSVLEMLSAKPLTNICSVWMNN